MFLLISKTKIFLFVNEFYILFDIKEKYVCYLGTADMLVAIQNVLTVNAWNVSTNLAFCSPDKNSLS